MGQYGGRSKARNPGWARTAGGCTVGWIVALGVVAACATSPTGRKQLMLVEDEQLGELGAQSFAQIQRQFPVSQDQQLQRYVQCVANRIIAQLDDEFQLSPGRRWTVTLFEDDSANAFALPGGYIGVFKGLLDVAQTQDQLATVVGHEVGHVISNHSGERVSQALLAEGGMTVAGVLLQNVQYRPLVLSALGLGTQVGVLLPYSRIQETEADKVGLRLMAQAGFDPRASVQLWQNMAALARHQPPEFLSTHPSHGTRIETLQNNIPAALQTQQQAIAQHGSPGCQVLARHQKQGSRPKQAVSGADP